MKPRIAIIGSGDLGQLVAYQAMYDSGMDIVGFFDDFAEAGTVKPYGKVLGKVSTIPQWYEAGAFDYLAIGIGYRHMEFRAQVFHTFQGVIPFANIIHSSSYIAPDVTLGEGLVIHPGCTLDMHCSIGDNVLLNTSVTIAHDTSIGAHSFLAPSVAIAGFVSIGEQCNLGVQTTVIDSIDICAHVQTGGGTVVTKSIQYKGLYVGVPARKVSKR